ncbi:MAG: ribonuclease H-like domain-containing protein [Bacteroidales bacterium]|nr:ribonuclease H-like domain-containing protein [Lachnoclostridium sp.]MCM1383575.1 ribonuclease H-like domain-containing protein [Lachnoclostridium sp.]MCM1464142.1 ribonuclease H-like domain-containing protein [Bacteroidales bacterium]
MRISEETLEHFSISYPLEKIAPLEQFLFIDIETTGFTAKSAYLYLIGCAYYSDGNWHTIQWMAENYGEEGSLLSAFFTFTDSFTYLVHFNGNNFDLPFITQKCESLSLPYHFDNLTGIDLYKRISPYKFFLKLPNCKQKTLEQFLGINRKDVFSGGELIGIYHDYVKNPSEFSEKSLFLHNADDLKGMLEILPMLAYYDIFNETVKARKVQANYYKDYAGNKRKELLITITLPLPLPKPVSSFANDCYFRGEDSEATLRVPIYEEELKYFYKNYHDYYYLPTEDVALHKSVATFVEKENRIQASAANCYTRKFSLYLPQWDTLFKPFFKRDYKSRDLFFELTDELKRDRAAFTEYAKHILTMIASVY